MAKFFRRMVTKITNREEVRTWIAHRYITVLLSYFCHSHHVMKLTECSIKLAVSEINVGFLFHVEPKIEYIGGM
jgi:hypothetical protein